VGASFCLHFVCHHLQTPLGTVTQILHPPPELPPTPQTGFGFHINVVLDVSRSCSFLRFLTLDPHQLFSRLSCHSSFIVLHEQTAAPLSRGFASNQKTPSLESPETGDHKVNPTSRRQHPFSLLYPGSSTSPATTPVQSCHIVKLDIGHLATWSDASIATG
jgi:hypothetical protein